MEGIGIGTSKAIDSVQDSWADVQGLVGWWDFSDISSLYISRTSYDTPVTANNDLIGRVKNKAGWNKLGKYLTQNQDSYRPTFKTGGQNGHSYAYNDGTVQIGFFGGFTSSGTNTNLDASGIDGTNAFGYVTTTIDQLTILAVCKQDVEDISSAESLIQIHAIDTADSATSEIRITKETSDNASILFTYSSGQSAQNIPGSTSWDTDHRIITARMMEGTNNFKIYFDNTQEVQGTLNTPNDIIDFNQPKSAGRNSITIGGIANTSGAVSSENWNGRIYEVLVYERALSSAELTKVWGYLNTKYDIY